MTAPPSGATRARLVEHPAILASEDMTVDNIVRLSSYPRDAS